MALRNSGVKTGFFGRRDLSRKTWRVHPRACAGRFLEWGSDILRGWSGHKGPSHIPIYRLRLNHRAKMTDHFLQTGR